MSQTFDTLQAVRADLNRILLERSTAIDNALLALLTRQNYLLVGAPGTAKSMLVDALCLRIEGARKFKRVLNPGTTDADILGPQDLIQMADHGRYVRRHTRSIVEADVFFLDEIGRANQVVYDLLLQILGEERSVDEIGMDAPLHLPVLGSFAASNTHLTGNENLQALNNRFLLREEIRPLTERASLLRLATQPPKITDVQASMTLDDIRQAQQEAKQVQGNPEVLEAAFTLREQLQQEGVRITDRMWVWSFPLIKAHTWLQGEQAMTLDDLSVLAHAWWEDPKEKAVVQRAIYAVANPLQQRALEIEDDALDLVKKLPGVDETGFLDAAESANVQLTDMVRALMGDIKASRARESSKVRAIQSLKHVHSEQTKLAQTLAKRMGLGSIDMTGVLAG